MSFVYIIVGLFIGLVAASADVPLFLAIAVGTIGFYIMLTGIDEWRNK